MPDLIAAWLPLMREEEDNLLPPGGFIPVAEQFGLTGDIDRWVVRKVISWSLQRHKANPGWVMPLQRP